MVTEYLLEQINDQLGDKLTSEQILNVGCSSLREALNTLGDTDELELGSADLTNLCPIRTPRHRHVENNEKSLQYHQEIYQAIKTGNTLQAKAVMREHLLVVTNIYTQAQKQVN